MKRARARWQQARNPSSDYNRTDGQLQRALRTLSNERHESFTFSLTTKDTSAAYHKTSFSPQTDPPYEWTLKTGHDPAKTKYPSIPRL